MRNAEILVHAAAPGGVRDDARYRAQVQAILGFEPTAEGRRIIWQQGRETGSEEAPIEIISSTQSSAAGTEPCASGDELSDVLEANTILHTIQRQEERTAGSTDFRVRPHDIDVLVPSSDLSDGGLANQLKVRSCHRESVRLAVERSNSAPSNHTARHTISRVSARGLRRTHSDAESFGTPVSVIPDSQPEILDLSVSPSPPDEPPISGIIPGTQSFSEASSSKGKRRRLTTSESPQGSFLDKQECIPSSIITPGASFIFSDGDYRPGQALMIEERTSGLPGALSHVHDASNAKASEQGRQQLVVLRQRMEIHPSPPPAGRGSFKTHITPTLSILAERLRLPCIFNPLTQTRSLETLERGYWRIAISIDNTIESDGPAFHHQSRATTARLDPHKMRTPHLWTHAFFSRVWNFLTDFIAREGRAGWGVWCLLKKLTPAVTSAGPEPQSRTTTEFILKTYCWGEVVAHIYGLLFLATERRIRGMHAQWRDSADRVVIEML